VLGDINEWLPLGRPLRWLHELSATRPPLFALDCVWVRPRHARLASRDQRMRVDLFDLPQHAKGKSGACWSIASSRTRSRPREIKHSSL
jgi:hypothetical protein